MKEKDIRSVIIVKNLKNHVQTIHNYDCESCGNSSSQSGYLKSIKAVHVGQKILQLWLLWKVLHNIRKYEESHQDGSWKKK